MENDLADISNFEFIYTTKEVAEKVGIKTPTVRKYGQILEQAGYEFKKTGARRDFRNADIIALKKLKTSQNLTRTAQELALEQKQKSDLKNDTIQSDLSVSLGDPALIPRDIQKRLIESDERYKELLNIAQGMALELVATKENVENILDELTETKRKEAEKQAMIAEMREELQSAAEAISEMKEEREKEKKKPGFFKRLFG